MRQRGTRGRGRRATTVAGAGVTSAWAAVAATGRRLRHRARAAHRGYRAGQRTRCRPSTAFRVWNGSLATSRSLNSDSTNCRTAVDASTCITTYRQAQAVRAVALRVRFQRLTGGESQKRTKEHRVIHVRGSDFGRHARDEPPHQRLLMNRLIEEKPVVELAQFAKPVTHPERHLGDRPAG